MTPIGSSAVQLRAGVVVRQEGADMIVLKKERAGCYTTLDGKFSIEYNEGYETWCDDPHPMKVRVDQATKYELDRAAKGSARRITKRTKQGYVEYLTWQCPGGEEHTYSRWIVWDNESGDYPAWTGPSGFDTRGDAAAALEHHLREGGSR